MKIKKMLIIRKASLLCLFISFPCNLLGTLLKMRIFIIIGTPLLIVYILLSLFFWRCPYCKERLPMRFNAKDEDYINDVDGTYQCPYCNKNII